MNHFKPIQKYILFFLASFGITLLAGIYMDFHVSGNDFWSPLYYGRHITWEQRESFYNGFYPIGYAWLIGQFPYTYVVPLAYLLNAILTGLLVASIAGLASAYGSSLITGFTLIFAMAIPPLFEYANTVGADIGSAAFTALAVYLLWCDRLAGVRANHSVMKMAGGGASLGLAVLYRNHAIVSSILIALVYFFVAGIKPIRYWLIMMGVFFGVVSLQLIANLISGHGLFETAQVFNVYKLFYGMDWANPPPPEVIQDFSITSLFLEDPNHFLQTIFPWFRFLAALAWPGLGCTLIAQKKSAAARFGLFAAAVIILYAIPLSLGDSLRAQLNILSLYLTTLGILIFLLLERVRTIPVQWKGLSSLLVTLVVIAGGYQLIQWSRLDQAFLQKNRAEHTIFESVEQILMQRGMSSSDQVFSDRLDFYLPNQPPYLTRQIEGFYANWMWGYNQEYESLPHETWTEFAEACRQQGIDYLVLSPNSALRGFFFPQIYEAKEEAKTFGLNFDAQRGNLRIYQFIK